tara:strand:+ start:321 stop:962 length:642 start_codon:yes stop_codon:yes gene_type:complete
MESPEIPHSQDTTEPEAGNTAPAHRGRPENTIFSILLMALLSAGALYGVAWTIQAKETIVNTWDFRNESLETSPWHFPGDEHTQNEKGTTFVLEGTGPGPEIILPMDSDSLNQIRVTLDVTRTLDNSPVKFFLDWYWATTDDIAAANGIWPYNSQRGIEFLVLDRDLPNTYTAQVGRHSQWNGTIAQGVVTMRILQDEIGPYNVCIERIEFLE